MRRLSALLATCVASCGPSVALEQPAPASESSTSAAAPATSSPSGSRGNDGSQATEPGMEMESTATSTPEATTATTDTTTTTSDTDSTSTTGPPLGCSKVDFLVVDNTRSMWDEQGRIQAAFPGFLDALANGPNALTDVHILVTDVDAWVFEMCETSCECEASGVCDSPQLKECGFPCATYNSCQAVNTWHECGVTTPLECEDVLGAGVTHPRGQDATNAPCDFASGARYIDSTEPDIGAAFQCAAGVGTGSWNLEERTLEAVIRAVEADSQAAACNEGWLRDDAILVVVIVTDEKDDTRQTGFGVELALVAAKDDNHDSIVVLGLIGDDDLADPLCIEDIYPDNVPNPGAEVETGVRLLLEQFEGQSLRGSICEPTYDEFFANAVPIVEATCDAFVPPA